jgi:3-oxoacyl-[acyl-carrier-protein] synthase-3
MVETITRKSGFSPEQTPFDCLGRYGNLGASSIPAQICAHFAGKKDARGRIMLCAFGAGLAAASCILSLEDVDIRPIFDYVPPEDMPSREERIGYWHGKFKGRQATNTSGTP